MTTRTIAATLSLALAWGASTAAAPHEGVWVGGFHADSGPVFVRLALGGSDADVGGRIDFPQAGEHSILLLRVRAVGRRVSFEVPGTHGSLQFDGLVDGDRFRGSVRQGFFSSSFDLLRAITGSDPDAERIAGHYEFGASGAVLVYRGPLGPMFVDYRTGRTGVFYRLADGRYVAGPSLIGGYPVQIAVTFDRDAAGRITGLVWRQSGLAEQAARRDLYRREPASFENGDVRLEGTLLLPHGPGPHPAVVMIQGSGQVGREALVPAADGLARHGVAVLIHDKRGCGTSTGSLARATFEQLALDALAGVAWLAKHPAIDRTRIGVLGASLGGWVAPLAASMSSSVAFVIVEAAPATTPAEHERERVIRQMRADGHAWETVAKAATFMDRKFKVARTGKGWKALQEHVERARREGWLGYVNAPASLESLRWNWQHVLSFDPEPVLRRLTCPVLVLYGERDTIVSPDVHLARMRHALAGAITRDVTVQVVPGANHNFLAASTGGPAENLNLNAFADGYFDTRLSWLRERVGPAAAAR